MPEFVKDAQALAQDVSKSYDFLVQRSQECMLIHHDGTTRIGTGSKVYRA